MSTKNSSISIALISGGLDSATAAAMAIESGHKVIGLSFNYGQRHKRELKAAVALASHLKLIDHEIININLAQWGGSSLTDYTQSIPKEGVVPGKIPNTYVPGRNTVFIAIGLSLAEARGANQLILGINAMDYSGYPDCRPDYLKSFQALANLSSKAGREGKAPKLLAPLMYMNKIEIVKEALRLEIPINQTWSCYSELEKACGLCDSCRIRNEALVQAGRSDLCSK
ncbi:MULTISPECIES: 7-cyano-7-deazaguanine synthase QueC [Prochlorococcus]|uniref:7-cyano-7-deazaguanine synthase QueC n=1 Tax=Prochlorococcus TaxID=1218 RepID=UPI000533907B|nr:MULTISPECIES: 7-cyano-7-deazaguanine synthase QueC [Prochlorococcus]KGG13726.1 Queuosine Biosynthesis QueC ATPase [Prochlorococcus sp. MIT 0601]